MHSEQHGPTRLALFKPASSQGPGWPGHAAAPMMRALCMLPARAEVDSIHGTSLIQVRVRLTSERTPGHLLAFPRHLQTFSH